MTAHALLDRLQIYRHCRLTKAIDAIESAAQAAGYSVNVIDPLFNTHSIDEDHKRLNVRTDADGLIVSFTIG